MAGKQEFTKFINYINDIKLSMPNDIKSNLGDLINKWNRKNKKIDDYFEMKENHTYLNEFFNLGFDGTKKENKLWLDYINKAMDYRVKNMHKSKNLIDLTNYIDFNDLKIINEKHEE